MWASAFLLESALNAVSKGEKMHGFRWHLKYFILTPSVCFCKAQASTDVPSHLEPVFEAESLAFRGLPFQPPPSSYLRDKQID